MQPLDQRQLAEMLGFGEASGGELEGWTELQSPLETARLFRVSVRSEDGSIPCLVYEPRDSQRRGNVVALHQHNNEYGLGKSEVAGLAGAAEMAYGFRMARLGYFTVMPDFRGFEDRRFVNDAIGEQRYALNRIASGGSLHGEYVSDVGRVIVAFTRAGQIRDETTVIGHSLGGQIAFLALALLPYVSRGVVSSGVTTFAACEAAGVLHNPGWYIPTLGSRGGYQAVARLLNGKRTLFLCARHDDYFPERGAADVIASVGADSRTVEWRDGGHALTPEALDRLTEWCM